MARYFSLLRGLEEGISFVDVGLGGYMKWLTRRVERLSREVIREVIRDRDSTPSLGRLPSAVAVGILSPEEALSTME